MDIVIAGCSYVGSALRLLLAAEGRTVFGLRRNASALPPGITPVHADLATPLPSAALSPNLDAVVHTVSPNDAADEA